MAKGSHEASEVQCQTRQHSLLINLLGVKRVCIGANSMDCEMAARRQLHYNEIAE